MTENEAESLPSTCWSEKCRLSPQTCSSSSGTGNIPQKTLPCSGVSGGSRVNLGCCDCQAAVTQMCKAVNAALPAGHQLCELTAGWNVVKQSSKVAKTLGKSLLRVWSLTSCRRISFFTFLSACNPLCFSAILKVLPPHQSQCLKHFSSCLHFLFFLITMSVFGLLLS